LKHCQRCGARLASDHLDEEFCSPCQRWKRDHEPLPACRRPYHPRSGSDVRLLRRLLRLFKRHQGVPLDVLNELCIGPEDRQYVKDAVKALRRQGYVIVARERVAGYTFLGKAPVGGFEETVTATLGTISGSQTPTSPV